MYTYTCIHIYTHIIFYYTSPPLTGGGCLQRPIGGVCLYMCINIFSDIRTHIHTYNVLSHPISPQQVVVVCSGRSEVGPTYTCIYRYACVFTCICTHTRMHTMFYYTMSPPTGGGCLQREIGGWSTRVRPPIDSSRPEATRFAHARQCH